MLRKRLQPMPTPDYERGGVKLYHADCYKLMPYVQGVHLLCTDPPYDVHAGYGGGGFGKRRCLVDTGDFTDGGCDYSFLSGFKNWFCFCSREQLWDVIGAARTRPRWNILVYNKINPMPTCNNKYLPDVEFVVHGYSANRLFGGVDLKKTVFSHPNGDKVSKHPNEKPLKLMRKLILLGSLEGELVFDPFMGSGSTGVACVRHNRRFLGIERDRKFFDVAVSRIDHELDHGRLMDMVPNVSSRGR